MVGVPYLRNKLDERTEKPRVFKEASENAGEIDSEDGEEIKFKRKPKK